MPAFGHWDRMLKSLDLSDEQKAKWEELKKEYTPKMTELFEKTENILTPEQKKARDKAFKEAMKSRQHPSEFRKVMKNAIKLTEEQKTKLKEGQKDLNKLRKEFHEKIKAILTPEQQEELRDLPQGRPGGPRGPRDRGGPDGPGGPDNSGRPHHPHELD